MFALRSTLVISLGLVALAGNAVAAPRDATPACVAAPSAPDATHPIVAVLAGTTRTDGGASANARKEATLARVLSAGFEMKARLLVGQVGSGVADGSLVVNTQLVPKGPNDLFRQSDQRCMERAIGSAFDGLLARSTPGPVDALAAFRSLAAHLVGLGDAPVHVVVLSSMLNGTTPLVLRGRNPASTGQLLARVEHAGLLPDCSHWSVYVIGPGVTSTGSLSDVADQQLENVWSAFFARCGARLVVWDQQLTQFPVTTAPLVVVRRARSVVVTLPASVLFGSGSATLQRRTVGALTDLLGILSNRYPRGAVTVAGYTDSRPTSAPGGNPALSRRRAKAVVRWLTARGIERGRIRAIGKGASHPVASNATPLGRQANRRVVVTIATSA